MIVFLSPTSRIFILSVLIHFCTVSISALLILFSILFWNVHNWQVISLIYAWWIPAFDCRVHTAMRHAGPMRFQEAESSSALIPFYIYRFISFMISVSALSVVIGFDTCAEKRKSPLYLSPVRWFCTIIVHPCLHGGSGWHGCWNYAQWIVHQVCLVIFTGRSYSRFVGRRCGIAVCAALGTSTR